MKNGKLLTTYLDYCEWRNQEWEKAKHDLAAVRAANDRLGGELDEAYRLHQACLDDGWTLAEIDAAYGRRFGISDKEIARMRAGRGR